MRYRERQANDKLAFWPEAGILGDSGSIDFSKAAWSERCYHIQRDSRWLDKVALEKERPGRNHL